VDWADSQDLIDLFLSEVDERAGRLAAGAAERIAGSDPVLTVEQLVRDAHTLKGSSNMLGKVDVGAASSAMERAWKRVAENPDDATPTLLATLADAADVILKAARDESLRAALGDVTGKLVDLLDGVTDARELASVEYGNASPDPPEERWQETAEIRNDDHGEANLGGLLGTVREELSSAVTRVDTGDLYRLINRSVEIGLDTEALADLTHVAFEGADPVKLLAAWRGQLERLAKDVTELQEWAVSLANVPLTDATETYPQFVRFLGRRLSREVRFDTRGADILIDRQIVDLIREPLRHLIVNAVDHGIEPSRRRVALGKTPTGTVRLDAEVRDERLVVSVTDDGGGIDWEAVTDAARLRGLGLSRSELESHLFRPGFTTITEANEFSGTGDGLALVADAADRVGGSVAVDSRQGTGTRITMDLPVSLVLQNIVIIASGDQFFGITEAAAVASTSLETSNLRFGATGRELLFRGEAIPVVSFSTAMGLPESTYERDSLVLKTRSGLVAVTVDEIIDRRRVAVKSLGPILDGVDHIVGAAFLGAGEVLVMVDHNHLGGQARRPLDERAIRPKVLVVDDSAGVRQIISATLRGRGFDVTVAPGAAEAMDAMGATTYDALVVDYSMPRSNGVDLVRTLRHRGVMLPIVMVSGVAEDEDKGLAWEAGVDAYLDKFDIRRGALVASLRRLLEEGNGRH